MNEGNLTPFNTLSRERTVELAVAGGKASGETRRRKRDLKKAIEIMLSMPLNQGEVKEITETEDGTSFTALQDHNLTVADKIGFKLISMAKEGDLKAMEMVMKVAGALSNETSMANADTFNTMVFVNQTPNARIDKVYPELKRLSELHGEQVRPVDEFYDAQLIIVPREGEQES